MQYTDFGKTGLKVSRTSFGCIPIQRISYDESTALLRRAYDSGVTLFDTANAYTTSEERIGIALQDVRSKIVIATKTAVFSPEKMMANIENSLRQMRTDYIDVLQIHNPNFLPVPGEENEAYDTVLLAKKQGKIRHIGITYHQLSLALKAVESGFYETVQYPLSYLSVDEELKLSALCKEHNVGLLAMKGMAGGLLTNARAAFTFLRQFENIVPLWGVQRMEELEEFLRYEENPPELDDTLRKVIQSDLDELGTSFCRGCGYCLPCPVNIPIHMASRVTFFMRRYVRDTYLTDQWKADMDKIDECTGCGHCQAHCPYHLNPPEMLKAQQSEYYEIYDRIKREKQ